MTRPVHALMLGLALSFCAQGSFAALVENKGTPEQNVATMTSYGVDVPTRTALKTVVPAGWQLFVHRTATLPETLSWKIGEAWPNVLAELAEKHQVAALIDWDSRTVMLRPPALAMEESAKRVEIAQAATTPLPRFMPAAAESVQPSAATAPAQAPVEAVAAPVAAPSAFVEPSPAPAPAPVPVADPVRAAAPAPTPQVDVSAAAPVVRPAEPAPAVAVPAQPVAMPLPTVPEPSPVAHTPQGVAEPVAVAAPAPVSDEFRYTEAAAAHQPGVRAVAQAIANRFGMRLVYMAEDFKLKGPVTLLAESAEQDARLLERAIGVFSPVVIEVARSDGALRVYPKNLTAAQAALLMAANAPATLIAQPGEPVPAVVSVQPVVATSAPAEQPAVSTVVAVDAPAALPVAPNPVPAVSAPLVLRIAENSPLEDALFKFARDNGYTFEWKVAGGFESSGVLTYEGRSMAEVLGQVVPKLGLSADIYTRDKHIVVRAADVAYEH